MNISSLDASNSLYLKTERSDLHKNYTFINEIGKGTHSTVYLSKNNQGEIVAIKKYEVSDKEILDSLHESGMSIERFIRQIAEKEMLIGQLTDHPNIVKVREVFFEKDCAYVVMDYVKGETFEVSRKYDAETRIAFMQQFLGALEHFLLRNIIIDDLWSENLMISNECHLTIIDLGGNEIITHESELPVSHYLEMFEMMLTNLGGETANVLETCKDILPASLRNETLSPNHIRPLVMWIEELQKKLATPSTMTNTISEKSAKKVFTAHSKLQSQYPDHISFNTAQHSNFLAYSLVAESVLKKFSPGKYPESYLRNTHVIRYPCDHLPKNIEDLFKLLPMREDYDTAYPMVGDTLISVSPSLKEKESQESAWDIFEKNEREASVENYIYKFLESEKTSSLHFKNRIEAIVQEAPQSNEGLIYNYFIPQEAPIHKSIYLSQPYGIPVGDPLSQKTLSDFYKRYKGGMVKEDNSQLRFLPSALIPESGFDLSKVKSYRFTTIPMDQIKAYAKRIEKVVGDIYIDHIEEMLQLARLASDVETETTSNNQQKGYLELCYRHLRRHDIQLALYYWHKIQDQNPQKASFLPGIITSLLSKNELKDAEVYFQQYESTLVFKDQIVARLALHYIERDNRPMLDLMLKKFSEGKVKAMILALASSKYPEYIQESFPNEEDETVLMSDDELINIAK